MKLARPLPHGAARDRHRARGGARARRRRRPRPPDRGATVAPPGFLNLRLADARPRAHRRRDPRRARALGPARAGEPARGQRRVRVGQPDRAAPRRQRPRARSSATCCAASSRPAASASRASTTSTIRAARSATSARRSPRSGAASRPRGRLQGRLRRRPRGVAARRRLGGGDDAAAPTPTGSSATGPPAASARASRRASTALGVRFDVWTSEARLHDEGWVDRAVERLRERGHVYEQDGAVWFRSTAFGDDKDRVIYPLQRRADLLRRRHRLRHREVQPRLRPPHLHLGRRPPRDGRPGPQRRRGDGLRPRRRPDAALLVGPLRARRRGGLDVEAGRRVHHARRPAGRGRRRRRALVLRVTGGHDRHRLRHRAGEEAVEREPGLLRPVRPRPDRLDPAQGGRRRAGPGRDRRGPAGRARPRPRWPGRSPASRRSSRTRCRAEETQGITAYATELATTFHALLSRRAGRRRRGAGAVGRATRARARGAGHARERARPARDLRARVDVAAGQRPSAASRLAGQAEHAGDCRSVAASSADDDPAVVPPSPGRTWPVRAASPARSSRPSRTPPRRRPCPRRSRGRRAHAPSGPVEDAPGGRRPSPPPPRRRPPRRRRVREPDRRLELAERVLERDRPAGRRAAPRGRSGRLDVDRRLVGRVLLGMEDLLGRLRHPVVERVDRRPAALAAGPLHEATPGRVREGQRLAQDRRHRWQQACVAGSLPAATSSAQLGRRQVAASAQ